VKKNKHNKKSEPLQNDLQKQFIDLQDRVSEFSSKMCFLQSCASRLDEFGSEALSGYCYVFGNVIDEMEIIKKMIAQVCSLSPCQTTQNNSDTL